MRGALHSARAGLARGVAACWPVAAIGALVLAAASGQGLLPGAAEERLDVCGAHITETVVLAESALLAISVLVLLGITGWRRSAACGGGLAQGGARSESPGAGSLGSREAAVCRGCGVLSCAGMPKHKVIKIFVAGAMGTADNIMYLQAMMHLNPAAVMVLRLTCSLALLTLGEWALRTLRPHQALTYGLFPLALSSVTHIAAAAAESPAVCAGEKPQIAPSVFEVVVLVCCPFTAAAEALGVDLLFLERAVQEGPAGAGAGAEPHPVLAFVLHAVGSALMGACIHAGWNGGRFPLRLLGCSEGAPFIVMAAMYVLSYKLAMLFCGGSRVSFVVLAHLFVQRIRGLG